MSLYIDLSEFLTHPITTGIQRITGEMCKYLPPSALTPVRVHRGTYVRLPSGLISAIGDHFRQGSHSGTAEIHRLGDPTSARSVKIDSADTVLVPEVFDEPGRLTYFREQPDFNLEQYRFIVFDLLPLTHPEYFWADKLGIYEYFKLLRRATHCGFISEDTRQIYYGRLKRTDYRGGVVLPLGCDSLGPRPTQLRLNRGLNFTVIGTIEPRKNPELVLDAFEPLLREVKGLRLSFVGRMGWVSSAFAARVHALAADENSGFRFFSAPGDDSLRSCIAESRATIYVSVAEGYGLPPLESLWLGTPVIASKTIPSLNGLNSSAGIHFVDPLSIGNLRRAVLSFLNEEYANSKTQETLTLKLPTWRSFTDEVLHWCAS